MEIKEFEGRGLRELLRPFSVAQSDYLCLVALGVSIREASEYANRKPQTTRVWRLDDPHFKALEEYLIENRDIYAPQVQGMFSSQLILIDKGLIDMAQNYIEKWDTLTASQQQVGARILDMVKRFHPVETKKGGYDEVILRRHRDR